MEKLIATNPMIVEARAGIARTQKERSQAIFSKNFKQAEDLTRSLNSQKIELKEAIRSLKAAGWQ